MKNIFTRENIDLFAYSNRKALRGPVRGVVIEAGGLGFSEMFGEDTGRGKRFAEKGILYIFPYHNPWAWMNDATVRFCDDISDLFFDMLGLDGGTPVGVMGGSMGGQQALVYSYKSKRVPACCAVNCPVCDLVYHYGERPDLPRTLYSAYCLSGADTIEEALESGSPVHNVDRFPAETKYLIYHCTGDMSVNITAHSRRLVSLMRERGLDPYYEEIPGRGHCDLPEDTVTEYEQKIAGILAERGI